MNPALYYTDTLSWIFNLQSHKINSPKTFQITSDDFFVCRNILTKELRKKYEAFEQS